MQRVNLPSGLVGECRVALPYALVDMLEVSPLASTLAPCRPHAYLTKSQTKQLKMSTTSDFADEINTDRANSTPRSPR